MTEAETNLSEDQPARSETPNRRKSRRLAMQLLYQLGFGTPDTPGALASIVRGITPEAEDGLVRDLPDVQEEAVKLALAAWQNVEQTNELLNEISPDWPVKRQPPVDCAILRLAHYELTSGRVPARVAINEAIELAKEYASENSPAFVNGVLDKMAKHLGIRLSGPAASTDNDATTPFVPSAEDWLTDAVDDKDND